MRDFQIELIHDAWRGGLMFLAEKDSTLFRGGKNVDLGRGRPVLRSVKVVGDMFRKRPRGRPRQDRLADALDRWVGVISLPIRGSRPPT